MIQEMIVRSAVAGLVTVTCDGEVYPTFPCELGCGRVWCVFGKITKGPGSSLVCRNCADADAGVKILTVDA